MSNSAFAPVGAVVLPATCYGRLTLSATQPVPTADISGATVLYFLPYSGSIVSLYDGTQWHYYPIPAAGLQLSLASVAGSTVYDVYLDWNGGTPILGLLAWASGTARATALTQQDGVYMVGTTRRYLGTICASGAGQCSDTIGVRYVWNYYNRKARPLYIQMGSSNSYNGNPAPLIGFNVVIGVVEEALLLEVTSLTGGASPVIASNWIYDTTSNTQLGQQAQTNFGANMVLTMTHRVQTYFPPIGTRAYVWYISTGGSGTATWYQGYFNGTVYG